MMIMNIEYIWLNKKNETNFAMQNYICPIWRCVLLSIWHGISFYAVLFHMHLQITRTFAGVVALLAGKRFLVGVWKHVILHTTVVTARIVALFTSKGLFSSLSELVSLQILRLSGGIVTLLTTERLLSWMDSHANHSILFCSNQGSPSFSKWSKSADILKFCPASSWRFWPLPCPAPPRPENIDRMFPGKVRGKCSFIAKRFCESKTFEQYFLAPKVLLGKATIQTNEK